MDMTTIISPFKGLKKLWDISFSSPKSADGLEEFNTIANIASRGCLLIGGLTSTGYTYLLSYSIFKGILPLAIASFLSIMAVVFLFVIFDVFLGVTFPLWARFWVQGRFKKDKKAPGNGWMRLAGVSLFVIAMAVAAISIAFSYSAAEVPVMMSLTNTQDSTKQDLSKAFQAHLTLQKIIESYDKDLEKAEYADKKELKKLQDKGAKLVIAAKKKYSHPMYSRNKFISRVERAKKDSASKVDAYEKKYDRVQRDKEHSISLAQSSSSRMEIASMQETDRLQGMFDRKMELSISILRWLGIVGTVLFMFIKFVQTVLNTGISASDKAESLKKQNSLFNKLSGTDNAQAFNKSSRNDRERKWNKTSESRNSVEYTKGYAEQSGTTDTVLVPYSGEYKTVSQIKSAISRHANKYNVAITPKGKENEYMKFLSHVDALGQVDKAEAARLFSECQKKYNMPEL